MKTRKNKSNQQVLTFTDNPTKHPQMKKIILIEKCKFFTARILGVFLNFFPSPKTFHFLIIPTLLIISVFFIQCKQKEDLNIDGDLSITENENMNNNSRVSVGDNTPDSKQVSVGDSTPDSKKDVKIPTVEITKFLKFIPANVSEYSVSGTCSENGRRVTVYIDGKSPNSQPTCIDEKWNATFNVLYYSDGSAKITAEHTDAEGNKAIQATKTVIKDTVKPSVTINNLYERKEQAWTQDENGVGSSKLVSLRYTLDGNCSENGRKVTVHVRNLTGDSTCSSKSWIFQIEVISLADGPVLITADHTDAAGNKAPQASRQETK